jgi:hypothetical protein
MKTLKLPFCHSVLGKVSISHPENGRRIKSFKVKSNIDNEVEISLNNITPGEWNISFEWEQDEELFTINKHVVVD